VKFKYPISNINQSTFSDYINNSKQFFEWTMAVNHEANQNQANSFPEGTFKAVCLSGFRSNNNTGGSDRIEDGYTGGGSYCNVIVRPLDSVGFDLAIPDPRKFADSRISPNEQTQLINLAISSHKPLYIARSNFKVYSKTSIEFGQIVECYFESGNISKGNAGGLRFKKPSSPPDFGDGSFRDLAEIPGVSTSDLDFQGTRTSLLGDLSSLSENDLEQAVELGLSVFIRGERPKPPKFIVIHYSANTGGMKSALNYENKYTAAQGGLGYHYMIDRNGAFYESCPPDRVIYHGGGADKKVTGGAVGNKNSIGVCLINAGYERKGVPKNSEWIEGKFPNGNPGDATSKTSKGFFEPYTDVAYKKAVEICANMLNKYPNIQASDIVGHSDISSAKSDPGPAWDMEKFRIDVAKKSKRGQTSDDSSATAELYESLTG